MNKQNPTKTMKNKCPAENVSRRNGAPELPERCVIMMGDQNIEVPAVFKSWIFDDPKKEMPGRRFGANRSNDGVGVRKGRDYVVPMKRKKINLDLNSNLLDLVRLRVAQMHDCKVCALEHIKNLKANGETETRLHQLKNWRRKHVFNDREEAALSFAEALTDNPIGAISDNVVHAAFFFFNESEMLCLILAVLAANDWHYLRGFHEGNKTCRPPHE